MKLKKVLSVLLVVSMLAGFTGCGNSKQPAQGGTKDKVVELTFWHAMGGTAGQALQTMVDNFNKSQSKIHVKAIFQGTYDDSLTKLKTAMNGKSGPDVVQVYDIGTRFMVDSGWVYPMQNYLDADKSFDVNVLEKNPLGYYTVNNKLYSMPFNSSTPILFYNKTAFKAAGLDPDKPPKTFKEVEDFAKKLTKKDSSGKVTQYGYSMAIYGWYFEQFLAHQGFDYVNNGNGRTAKPTAVTWDQGQERQGALNLLNEWKKLLDEGVAGNFGRKTDDTQNAFIAGRTAMIINSSSTLNSFIKGAGNRFEVGTAYLPSLDPNGDKGGIIIGGASLWAIDNKDQARRDATWEFIKYMVSPDQQVYWSNSTGYFPVNTKVYDLQAEKDQLAKVPQFQVCINQLHDTPLTEATRGGCVGVFTEARAAWETEVEKMVQNKETPDQAIDAAAKKVNNAIANYNTNLK